MKLDPRSPSYTEHELQNALTGQSAWLTFRYSSRQDLLISPPIDLGIHLRKAHTQLLCIMARLRSPDDSVAMGVDGDGKRGGCASADILYSSGSHVCAELCTGGLGYI